MVEDEEGICFFSQAKPLATPSRDQATSKRGAIRLHLHMETANPVRQTQRELTLFQPGLKVFLRRALPVWGVLAEHPRTTHLICYVHWCL